MLRIATIVVALALTWSFAANEVKTATLSGFLTDAAGKLVLRQRMQVIVPTGPGVTEPLATVTDHRGAFELQIPVRHAVVTPLVVFANGLGHATTPSSPLSPGKRLGPFTLKLQAGRLAAFTVVDQASGRALPGVTVRLTGSAFDLRTAITCEESADSQGVCRFVGFPRGAYQATVIGAPALRSAAPMPVDLAEKDATNLRLEVANPGRAVPIRFQLPMGAIDTGDWRWLLCESVALQKEAPPALIVRQEWRNPLRERQLIAYLTAGSAERLLLGVCEEQRRIARSAPFQSGNSTTLITQSLALSNGEVELRAIRHPTEAWAGLTLQQIAGRWTCGAVAPGSPAERAGVQPGDSLLALNGAGTDGMDEVTLTARVSGKPGATVVVVTCRPNGSQRRTSRLQLEPRMFHGSGGQGMSRSD